MMIWERRRSNTRSIWNLCLSTGIVGTMSPLSDEGSARLVPVAGPTISPLELIAKAGGLLMGRQEQCDLRLKGDAVSRAHARFVYESGRWSIIDLKSRWGTFVNGVRLTPDRETPLGEGDLVRINPWTFRFASVLARSDSRIFDSQDDSHQPETVVQTITPDRLPNLNEELLALLLESASGIHASPDEKTLGQLLLEKACQGSGMPNAALLRPLNDAGRYEVIAARGPLGEELNFSRSLLSAASSGNIAELSGSSPGNISESIISLGVRSAICVPILLGQTPAAFLYLDARGRTSGRLQPLRPKASAFCMALARMGGLALSNLKRIEMERRSAQLEADLKAAATAQQWILPQRQGTIGPFRYNGQSRPGRHVGGDFYDVIPLSDDRMAIAIGDVSGKGIAASVLMTAAQGFLHAALEEIAEPRQAVIRLNHFIHERSESSKFVTLWVGVLNLKELLAHTSQGEVQGAIGLDSRPASPKWTADLRWSGIQLEHFLKARDVAVKKDANGDKPNVGYISGALGGNAQLKGEGNSTAKLLASLDGTARLWVRDGTVSHILVEAAGIDVAQALGVFVKGDDKLPMQCALAQFDLVNGKVMPEVFVIDTKDTTMLIDGDLSLATESLDLRMTAHPHDFSPLALRTPVKVTGTFTDPHIRPEAKPLIKRGAAAAVLSLANPLAALLALIDFKQSERDVCTTAVAHVEGAAKAGVKTGPAVSPPLPASSPKARLAPPRKGA